jgi:hypothetical protein
MIPEGGIAAVGFIRAWGFGFDLDVGPAYPELLSVGAFLPSPVNGEQLRQQSATLSFGGPVGAVDVGASREHTALSDGNARTTWHGLVRVPFQPHLRLIYAAGAQSFAQPSALYWSPETYLSLGLGPELSVQRTRGVSASLRILPGLASTSEHPVDGEGEQTSVFQLAAGASLGYRGSAWEIGGGASYGQGRTGDYRRFDATLYMSYAP